ncbi:hypothetical protein VDGD_20718 [Verticillium dahliae]|nr:hypothetical protein VDGD_20718 [Verticillium dahliae]
MYMHCGLLKTGGRTGGDGAQQRGGGDVTVLALQAGKDITNMEGIWAARTFTICF